MKIKVITLYLFLSISLFAQSQPEKVIFKILAPKAIKVSVAGSFNNWDPEANPLSKTDSVWYAEILLEPGYYYYNFVVDGNWIPDPSNDWKVNDGGENFNSIIKVGDPPKPKRKKSLLEFPKEELPQPVLKDNPEWIELYYAAWEMAWNKISQGTKENGFADYYMDEGFNELIFQWDTNFIVAFALYARNIFPAIQSLDNFYKKQRADGYIQRVYRETTGEPANEPTPDEPMVNPPLFAWIELKHYELTEDKLRIEQVLPILTKYYDWIESNMRDSVGKGLYYNTMLGSGMDNTPRPNVGKAGWVDMSSQQALAALCISKLAGILNETVTEDLFNGKYIELKGLINKYCWNPDEQFYFDITTAGKLSPVKHVGALWTMLAEIPEDERVNDLIKHLTNEYEFWRPNLIPTLSFDDPQYDKNGHYWRGSVWAPTNYMTIKGLEKFGYYELANQISVNLLSNLSNVYFNFTPDETKIAFEDRYDDGYQSLWECYSPEFNEPATRWDNTFYSRQDFVGWTGLGPIAILIENIIGIEVDVPQNEITWRIYRDDEHGIKNLLFGRQKIDLICTPYSNYFEFSVSAEESFELKIYLDGKLFSKKIKGGINTFQINL
jgi:hypothetical protein